MTEKVKFARTHLPCPMCTSSDGFAIRQDGSGFCFVCNKNLADAGDPTIKPRKEEPVSAAGTHLEEVRTKIRGISPATFALYGVKARVNDADSAIHSLMFTLPDGRLFNRTIEKTGSKDFWFSGENSGGMPLFGADKFPAGSAQAITITEGYLDALSAYEMMDSKYPNVAVQSVVTARTEASKAYDYLNSFDKIYIAFDADGPGQKAAAEVARLFDFNKVYIVQLDKELKDPNAYHLAGKAREFYKVWWSSKRFLPEGILASYTDFDQIIDDESEKPSVPYPFQSLQDLTYGIRTGELVLLTAQEGMGKTEIFRAIEYHLLKTTDANIGVIHLEESKARTLKGYVGYELKSPVHLPEYQLSKDDLKKHLRSATGRDERLHIYSHFGSDDPDVILSTIRFMAGACNCKYIFLDHITMVVSGLQGEDERKSLDYISTQLAMMVEAMDFTLFLISHVNDDGKTRGSRNIGKVADLRIDLHRDLTAVSDIERNTTHLTVSKNRYAGKTGPGGTLFFDSETYILEEPADTDGVPF